MEASFARMIKFNKEFADSKEIYRCQQAWHLKHKPNNGLFCPSNTVSDFAPTIIRARQYAALLDDRDSALQHMLSKINYSDLLWGSHIFGAWRNTLAIYELDEDIADSSFNSPIPDETPISIFKRLPSWCLYVKYPKYLVGVKGLPAEFGEDTSDIHLDGFWATFDQLYSPTKKTHTTSPLSLNLTPNIVDGEGNPVWPLQPVELFIDDDSTVGEAVEAVYDFYKKSTGAYLADGDTRYSEQDMEERKDIDHQLALDMLSSLLWLCAEEPDISNITGEPVSRSELQSPKHTVHPKTKNFITPSAPTVYNIGKRLGGEIRQMNDAIERDQATNRGKGKRPHIRRGHWHGYWRGTGQAREFFVKWQPAIFVNAG